MTVLLQGEGQLATQKGGSYDREGARDENRVDRLEKGRAFESSLLKVFVAENRTSGYTLFETGCSLSLLIFSANQR